MHASLDEFSFDTTTVDTTRNDHHASSRGTPRGRINTERVREAVRGREIDVLADVAGIERDLLSGSHTFCPKCGGRDRFRMIDPDKGAVFCNQCFNSRNGDVFAAVMWMLGVPFAEAVRKVSDYLGANAKPTSAGKATSKAERDELEIGSPELIDKVYRRLIVLASLSDAHRDALAARGVPQEAMLRLGYRTIPAMRDRSKIAAVLQNQFGPDILRVPGFFMQAGTSGSFLTFSGVEGMMFPCLDADEKVHAIKFRRDEAPANGGSRYLYLSSNGTKKKGLSPGARSHVPLGTPKNARVLRVTEGEMKANHSGGFSRIPCVSIPGVGIQKDIVSTLKKLGATTVRMAFDRDVLTNESVAKNCRKLVDTLRDAGFVVEWEQWPNEFKGIDDYEHARATGKTTAETEVLVGDAVDAAVDAALAAASGESTREQAGALPDSRTEVIVNTEEHRVNKEVASALSKSLRVYDRGGCLVKIINVEERWRTHTLEFHSLRHEASEVVRFVKEMGDDLVNVHVPSWTINAILEQGDYAEFRKVNGITQHPTMRPDGSVAMEGDYDPATQVFVAYSAMWPVADSPTREDAIKALEQLKRLVVNFPFQEQYHLSGWLSFLFTAFLRHLIDGPVPLFLIDANTRGSGKTLLAELVSLILTGQSASRLTHPEKDEEMRKLLTGILMAGDPLVLFDNLAHSLGCPSLDAFLTARRWTDRLLGGNQIVTLPICTTIVATGNNVALEADTARRTVYVRLQSPLENPEERQDFEQENIRDFVRQNRDQLLSAMVTIVRAYALAGWPKSKLTPWGSFEAWDAKVRHLIVWLGMTDPGETRRELTRSADRGVEALAQLIDSWPLIDPNDTGLTAAEIVRKLEVHTLEFNTDPASNELQPIRDALAELCGARSDKIPSPRHIGSRFRAVQGRVIGEKFLEQRKGRGGFSVWFVQKTGAPKQACMFKEE